MGDYQLNRLSPRDFEHLVQALALKVLGPAVMPFGDGPDGGREATYNGKMLYPSQAAPWDGYLVLQAKYCARPTGDIAKDGDWALKHLRADLAKFRDPMRGLRQPDYYLFVTNVVLTPVHVRGTKDRVSALLEEHAKTHGLKGYDVWDFDKLCRLLDAEADVRTSFAAFITPGDVLAAMMSLLQEQQPDFTQTMTLLLEKEFRADYDANLTQAGHHVDQAIALAQLFVDIRALTTPRPQPLADERLEDELPPGIVAEILHAGNHILKSSVRSRLVVRQPPRPEPGRFVLVGGPGQGKSTVAQWICQLYRTALLIERPPQTLTPETQTLLHTFIDQCSIDKLPFPVVHRFPVRIVLDQFASALAAGEVQSLLDFIVQRIKMRTRRTVTANNLRKWLGVYPWLLVLDGLDEVPVTSNRAQILEQVADFWSDVAVLDADVCVIATTRPQGYNEDFAPRYYQHRYLAPLSDARALIYAKRLVVARYGADPVRSARIIQRLTEACREPAVSHLMRSPLQVTIMTALVDRVGQPPRERWRLFQQYYTTIYEREIERAIPTSHILVQQRSAIHTIHSHVGLLLQSETEKASGKDLRLTAARFRHIVQLYLQDEGYTGDDLIKLVNAITTAALHRLVFLVGLEEDRVGFELRSFQEFMAAEAIADGMDPQVRERLVMIAPLPYWRNVVVFVAGKCFAERLHLRDMIVTICEQLDDPTDDPLAGGIRAGARLALDLLVEGIAATTPRYARSLARIAVQLAEIPDVQANTRLAAVYEPSFDLVFRKQLEQQLARPHHEQCLGAWALLLALIERQISWAEQLATTHWPADAAKQRQLLRLANGRINQPWLLSKLIELIPKSALSSLQGISWDVQAAHREVDVPAWLDAAQYIIQPYAELDRQQIAVLPQSTIGAHLTVGIGSTTMRMQKQLVALQSIPFSHSAWAPWVAAARFAADPTPVTMARELRWLATVWQPTADDLYDYAVAWPFAACVAMTATQAELLALANHVEGGQLGMMEQWIAAEQRWQARGITESDLFAMTDDRWPYPATVDQIGFPCSASLLQRFEGGELDHWDTLYSHYSACPPGRTKAWFAWHLCMLLTYPYWENWKCISTTPESLQQLFEDGCPAVVGCDLFDIIDFPVPLPADWIACMDWIGRQPFEFYPADEPCDEAQAIAEAFVRDPTRHGLLRVLGFLVIPGSACNIPVQILKPAMYQDKQDQLAVCFLRLAQGQWDDTEAGELAQYFVTFAHDSPRILTWVVRTVQNHDLPQAQIDIFALALWNAVCARPTGYAAPAQELLQRCMQERLSGWSTSEQRRVQGLPALA